MSRTTPIRRRAALVATGLAGGVALAVAAPLAASAHVVVSPGTATAGGYSVLTFAFSHGCDGSPTTALAIDLPEGIESVAPEIAPGWSIEAVGADEGVATEVIFTADEPIDAHLRATVSVQVKFAEDTAGQTVAFPVVQSCVEGENAWVELAEEGQDPHDLDAPAPLVTIAAAEGDGHDHGDHGDETDAGEESHDEEMADAETTAAPATDDPVARWLGAGGLVLGLAALITALVRGRSRAS
ncbi:YcnI family protein [Microbacterium koreense]|uniref:YcnI family protein n=1 Tax=Microbacterium koreense TaxID=323761 RepID=A0ABW2ZU31_9MICO